jgi:cellulose synthase/poly-beta-1,6-N-acetylglucosamine synthase-like glycosyltransferase
VAPAYRVAVVIPARTCPCRQVVSVLAQLSPDDRLVVVFNGLADSDRCKRQAMNHPLVTWIDARPPIGAGCARNLGVKALQGASKALLFCDADDCVAPAWLAKLACPLLDASVDLVGGSLRVRHGHRTPALVIPTVDYWHGQALFGGNMGITYEAWCSLGGFDESFTCCEDTDLAWRGSASGLKIRIVPGAIVDVHMRPPFQEFRQRFRWGKSSVQLLRIHGVGINHLPGLGTLFFDKATTGFAANPAVAAGGQWAGQCAGQLLGIMSRLRNRWASNGRRRCL